MSRRIGLRMRLWLGAVALTLLAMVAAGIAAYGLTRMQSVAAEAIAAQRRIEAYGMLSNRMSEWLIEWLAAPASGGAPPDIASVIAALDRIDQLVAEDVAAAPTQDEATRRTRQGAVPARMRSMFSRLSEVFEATPPTTPPGRAALAFHTTQAPPAIASQIEADGHRRDAALAQMQAMRRPLIAAALSIAIAAPVILVAFWLMVLRPLFRRLNQATRDAPALAMGHPAVGAAGHDELGLMFARLRQMAGRVARRGDRLEATVATRTAALTAANDRLARIDSTRRRFFADVGHELRTPLTVIMVEAELGENHPDAVVRASFQTIRNRSARLFRRVEDMLRIARSESGRLELVAERVELQSCIQAALADMAPVLRRAGITVEVNLGPVAVAADAEWLRQVFAGIFENAAKYAGRDARILVTGHSEGGLIITRIADDGPGIPAADADRIFQRFTREGAAPGFGVGLALARWVVEASGGKLDMVTDGEVGGLILDLALPLWREE